MLYLKNDKVYKMNQLLLMFLLLPSCFYFAQQKEYSSVNCDENFMVNYIIIEDTTGCTDELKKQFKSQKENPNLHEYSILLEEGFNDTLRIYLNGS